MVAGEARGDQPHGGIDRRREGERVPRYWRRARTGADRGLKLVRAPAGAPSPSTRDHHLPVCRHEQAEQPRNRLVASGGRAPRYKAACTRGHLRRREP